MGDKDADQSKLLRPILLICFLIVAVWFALGILWFYTFKDGKEAAEFGDSFGFVNALFSGLALGGVIIAVALQSQELRLQRQELEETREELKRSADAQADLVRLNSLANLTQAYMEQYKISDFIDKRNYQQKIKILPKEAEDTITYKLSVCTFLLQELYTKVSGVQIGVTTFPDIAFHRRKVWIDQYLEVRATGDDWRRIADSGNHDELQAHTLRVCDALERNFLDLLGYVDAVDDEEKLVTGKVKKILGWVNHPKAFLEGDLFVPRDTIQHMSTLFSFIDEIQPLVAPYA